MKLKTGEFLVVLRGNMRSVATWGVLRGNKMCYKRQMFLLLWQLWYTWSVVRDLDLELSQRIYRGVRKECHVHTLFGAIRSMEDTPVRRVCKTHSARTARSRGDTHYAVGTVHNKTQCTARSARTDDGAQGGCAERTIPPWFCTAPPCPGPFPGSIQKAPPWTNLEGA